MEQILNLTLDDNQGNVLLQLWDRVVHVYASVQAPFNGLYVLCICVFEYTVFELYTFSTGAALCLSGLAQSPHSKRVFGSNSQDL